MGGRRKKSQASIEREGIDAEVIAALRESKEPLSLAQLSQETGYPMSTIEKSMDRLRRHGEARMRDERRPVGKFGNLANVYEIGDETEQPIRGASVVFVAFRHPQDVAFFGEYRRAA